MKKLFNLFLALTLTFIAFIGFNSLVNAYEPNGPLYGENVIGRINDSEIIARDFLNKLTAWSNLYATDTKDLIDRDLIDNYDIDSIISKLRLTGHNLAADALESIKQDIVDDKEYLKTTFEMIEYYIDHDIDTDSVDPEDIYRKLRGTFNNLKTDINALGKIYYNLYYDELSNKIDNLSSYDELFDLYEELYELITGSKFQKVRDKIDKFKEIYISKDLEIYEPIIKDELRSYYETFKSDYNVLYNKLEVKLQTKLDQKLNEIIEPVDRTNISEVAAANRKIYDIMERIEEAISEANEKFTKVNNYFSDIDIFIEYADQYEVQILNRLQEAYAYTRSKLIESDLIIAVKNESDKRYIKLDLDNGLIIYDSKDLAPTTLINKLSVNYGSLRVVNAYNNKVGTKSRIESYYDNTVLKELIIVVRGDISPNGKIDITDLVNLCDKMYGLINLDNYQMLAADFDNNSRIDITDLVNLCDRIYQ